MTLRCPVCGAAFSPFSVASGQLPMHTDGRRSPAGLWCPASGLPRESGTVTPALEVCVDPDRVQIVAGSVVFFEVRWSPEDSPTVIVPYAGWTVLPPSWPSWLQALGRTETPPSVVDVVALLERAGIRRRVAA